MKVSVIIPAHNAEQYIAKAIESCLRQSYPPDEVVVVDDASTDRTCETVRKFPSPVKLLRLAENMGVSVARNRAVETATGDWLAFLDADDWFLPHKLEKQRQCILEHPNAVLIYSKHRMIPLGGSEQDGLWVPPGELNWRLRYQCAFHLCSAMLRRDVFQECGGFDPALRNAQDWDLWLKVLGRYGAGAFAAVPEPLVVYRRVAGSLSSSALRYFKVRHAIIENRSLYGAAGLAKTLLRRRIHAFNRYDAALGRREEGSTEDLRLVLKSLALWPFVNKMLPLKRYRVAVVMVMQHLGAWPAPFRSIAPPPKTHRDIKG